MLNDEKEGGGEIDPRERFKAARFRCRISFKERSPRLLNCPLMPSEREEDSLLPSDMRAVPSRMAARSLVSALVVLLSEASIGPNRSCCSLPPLELFVIKHELLEEDFFMHKFSGPSDTGGDADDTATGSVSRSASLRSSALLLAEGVLRGLNLCNERDRRSSLLVGFVVVGVVVKLLEECVRKFSFATSAASFSSTDWLRCKMRLRSSSSSSSKSSRSSSSSGRSSSRSRSVSSSSKVCGTGVEGLLLRSCGPQSPERLLGRACLRRGIGEVHVSTGALGRLIEGSANTCGGSKSFDAFPDIKLLGVVEWCRSCPD